MNQLSNLCISGGNETLQRDVPITNNNDTSKKNNKSDNNEKNNKNVIRLSCVEPINSKKNRN